jgi:glycosyltransferase involved in cell wall biosynthesis
MSIFDIKSLGKVVFESEASTHADVAVVIPLYNYESFILDCLDSVVQQTLEPLSVMVVDDGSTDEGPNLAADFLRKHADRFSSARIIRHHRNQGLSMARNSGIAWSVEPLLFMLDADNRVRAPALARLKSALEVDEADFSYSQLFFFGDEPGVGVADTWHVDRLRYGNTIDAMAMIRRAALDRVGGYAVLADDHGWEDYDLWCSFFTLGMRGVFLPELLCEYRRHTRSMTHTRSRKNMDSLAAEMALRHPEIFNREARICPIDQDLSISIPLGYKIEPRSKALKVAVVIHMFYPDMTEEIMSYVGNIPFPIDVFISTDSSEKKEDIVDRLHQNKSRTEVRVVASQGLDIAPRLIGFREIYDSYEYALLLHSKKSSHTEELRNWRSHFLQNLLGSQKVVESIFEIFDERLGVGIIAAQHFEPVRPRLGWGGNFEICKALAARFGVDLHANGFLDFPSGSMFWARSAALRPFFDAEIALNEFSPDSVGRKIDGTMAHAIERLVFVASEKAGFSWVKVAQPDLFERQDTIKHISDPAALHEFIANQRRILPSGGSKGLKAGVSCPI